MANIYYFSTEWCGPCKMFKPVVREVMEQTGKAVQFVDAQHNPAMAAKYSVSSVPTIVIEDGHNVVKLVGPQSKTKLLELFSR